MANPSAISNQSNNPNLPPDYVSLRTWIGVGAGMIGAFMAVLDIRPLAKVRDRSTEPIFVSVFNQSFIISK